MRAVEPTVLAARRRPYTVRDTPATIARIERDLRSILAAVRASDPSLRSLVLTGGFARGEGAMLEGRPQNDYDLVAVRGLGRATPSYGSVADELGRELGLHIDLAPVGAWRLPWVPSSIFWYETAMRGRVLWGADVLGRIPVRNEVSLDRREGVRLLVNRAAGLLLVTRRPTEHDLRLQAAKALLAALDAHLLAEGRFAPSQTERWHTFGGLRKAGTVSPTLWPHASALAWAFGFKTDPGGNSAVDGWRMWREARVALLSAVPVALSHARIRSFQEYTAADRLVERWYFRHHRRALPDVRSPPNATGLVRAATIRMLDAAPDGLVPPDVARTALAPLVPDAEDPLLTLERLRAATLQ